MDTGRKGKDAVEGKEYDDKPRALKKMEMVIRGKEC